MLNVIAFVKKWLNPKNEKPINRFVYFSASKFDPKSIFSDVPIILTTDENLAATAPADISNLSSFPVIIYVTKLDSEICDKLLDVPQGCPIYWIAVGKTNERPIDCYKRAHKEMSEAYGKIPLCCTIALKTRASEWKVYRISSTEELATIIKFTQLDSDFLNYEKKALEPQAKTMDLLPNELWQLNMPEDKKLGAYFPLLFFRKIRFGLTEYLRKSVYNKFSVAHFYQPNFGNDDLANMVKLSQQPNFGYDLKFQMKGGVRELQMKLNGQMQETPCEQYQWTYYGYQFESKIYWNEQNALDLINERIYTLQPSLIILDIQEDFSDNSCLQQIIYGAQKNGSMIWICCHDKRSSFPLITAKDIDVSAGISRDGDLFFTTHIHSLPNGFYCQNRMIVELEKQPIIRRSKHENDIEKIRQMTFSGVSEAVIAKSCEITIYNLRRIKRQFKIRKNKPLEANRRQGLDTKILRLYIELMNSFHLGQNTVISPEMKKHPIKQFFDLFPKPPYVELTPPQIKEIASKLKVAPSYVKKRLPILHERLC